MLWSIKIISELHYCCLLCYSLVRILLAAADDKGRRFSHHCCRQTSHYSINIEVSRNKLISTFINGFDGGIGTNMCKAAHPSGDMGSSNPRRWGGWRLHHHGDGVW